MPSGPLHSSSPLASSFKITKAAKVAIEGAVIGQPITQSEIMLRNSCPRKWYYRYAMRLGKQGLLDQNLIYGSIMHHLLERHYKGDPTPKADYHQFLPDNAILTPAGIDELELTQEKAELAFYTYRKHYEEADARLIIKHVEEIIEYDYKGLTLTGKMDMVANPTHRDGVFIWDWKTAGQFNANLLDSWAFRFQFLYYCWLYWKVTNEKPAGTMVNGLLKIGLRPRIADKKTKRKENQAEYLDRVRRELVVNREKYFYRQRLPMGSHDLERFEQEILLPNLVPFYRLGVAVEPNLWDIMSYAWAMNTNQCHIYGSNCEFIHLCKDGPVALGEFEVRDAKHQELVETEIENGDNNDE
jgi:hypothetical protein